MDNEEARFLLSACQPSGKDGDRPEIAEALAQARRDPELAGWLARERRSDAAISQQLRALEPPDTLRARLLAGGRASRRARHRRTWRVGLSLAAALALAAGTGWWAQSQLFAPVSSETSRSASLRAWQERCVGVFANPFFQLDLERPTYEPLARHLLGRQAPVADELPFNDTITTAVGCKVLQWRETVVSLTCFRSDTGELVHLFVSPRSALAPDAQPHGMQRAQVGAFATVTWQSGDLVMMVASKLPAEQLDRTLRAERAVAAAPLAIPFPRG